ncbi:hypothetical protein CDD82_4397 [Ophiocordyceps australis]|uniref:Kinesin-like protein n=1 Tax=Ophiocordyceps australis TaxID=1399860 RepID=A0A2C5Z734_9HYPO|nr:hypothetical protein CDD82_4397 [Ophiocordyceps australis]
MDKPSHNLFQVYLRLRPASPATASADRILTVQESQGEASHPSCITLNPPTDRRRAIEKFAFTHVFEEDASQLDVFEQGGIASLAGGVLGSDGGQGTDAMIATLGVTGSGKTHTILGSRSQRGLTQLTLHVLFASMGANLLDSSSLPSALESLQSCDASEASLSNASCFLEQSSGEFLASSRTTSRAATPMISGESGLTSPQSRRNLQRLSALPQLPDVSNISYPCDESAEYLVLVSMYEVHNDRIYDLLTPSSKPAGTKDYRRRPLLFKSTELSPDRKVVAGLRKVACTSFNEAIMVVEAGLVERRVAGTGSNSVSSRSHGFFCFEVKKRTRSRRPGPWGGSKLTIVDLAGSERAREAKTQGATLAEAGKINESLMYLGQCLQTQSEAASSNKPNVVPFRQCKLTELLFSNSFPSAASAALGPRRNPQRGIMIVTADPRGDFNATSQILRYSALAREVTVPRIPSITATILATAQSTGHQAQSRPFIPPGSVRSQTPQLRAEERATMEIAALEIARMSDEMDQMRRELELQTEARLEAEAHLVTMEDHMLEMEAAIRDECATEFEERLALELARFKNSLALEQERNDEHWDRKIDVLERGLCSTSVANSKRAHCINSGNDKENILVEDLGQEVGRLRRENAVLLRELACRSPTKRAPLTERQDFHLFQTHRESTVINLGHTFERMRLGNAACDAKASRGAAARNDGVNF